MVKISSWGNLRHSKQDLVPLCLANNKQLNTRRLGLAYGRGRSYGDVCLNPQGFLWDTSTLDHFIHFDPENGRLRCEAGVLLRDIQNIFIPQGWMLPVTPGTQFVTVGGAIANDVHGKNHHVQGSFGNQLHAIKLLRTTGELIECSTRLNSEWFRATVGGLGLTGVILEAELQLRPVCGPWLDTETLPYQGLDEFFHLADESEMAWEYTVSWLDCTSARVPRGIFMRANHSEHNQPDASAPAQNTRNIPVTPPVSLVNRFSLKLFNALYFSRKKRQRGIKPMHYQPFLFPLDHVLNWNRIYGPKGFYQYQSVIPWACRKEATRAMLHVIAQSAQGSFLSVLKTLGKQVPAGMLSFPQEGVTLALDFPNQGKKTEDLFQRLDAIVFEAGGRLYPAKDARMPASLFKAGYPRLKEFLDYRDPGIQSALAKRLMDNEHEK